nr:DUF131 domain-containing protein [uncultured Methanolobus sp.]
MRSPQDLFITGITVVIMGFIFVIAGMLVSMSETGGDFGGLILIGPIPIAFGSSPEITSTMLWAGVLIAVIYLVSRRKL